MIISGQCTMKISDESSLKHVRASAQPSSFYFPCYGKNDSLLQMKKQLELLDNNMENLI